MGRGRAKKKKKAAMATTGSNVQVSIGGQVVTMSNNVSSHICIPNGMTSTFVSPQSLTSEEDNELTQLEKTRQAQQPLMRAQEFKKLKRSNREFLLSIKRLGSKCDDIRQAEMPKSPRQLELENKRNGSLIIWNATSIMSSNFFGSINEKLFDTGMTLEEMEKAHTDACAEEILLNEKYDAFESDPDPISGC
ncbi:MAG: hypothetical protein WC517_04980 [Patescibacteria group bacterium]